MRKDHQFGKSQQVAINFLQKFTEAISSWKNFIWFQKIAISEIEETGEYFSNDCSKYKEIKRTIFFYGYKDKLIARVYLQGNQFTNTDGSKPTFWKVIKVHYVNNYDESRVFLLPTWTKVEIEEKDQVLV